MPALITQEGQRLLLQELLDSGTTRTDWHLDLFMTSLTLSVLNTRSTFTAGGVLASFNGYGQRILTRQVLGGTYWSAPTSSGNTLNTGQFNAKSSYAGTISWTMSSGTNVTIYGHFICNSGDSISILAERWGSSITLTAPSTLTLTPVLELGASTGAQAVT